MIDGYSSAIYRDWIEPEIRAMEEGFESNKIDLESAVILLGKPVDICIGKGRPLWTGVPENVWNLRIGGHQVMKRWLTAYMKSKIKRSLDGSEIRYFTEMGRRLTELVLMFDQLDANYEACRDNAYQWPTDG